MKNNGNLIEIRPSRFGRGLFSLVDIPASTIVCTVEGEVLNFTQTLHLGERESHSLQVDTDKYILCIPPFLYSNHSCEPNCGLNSDLQLFALEDIPKGAELFWDYSTSMYERSWTMKCFCGSKNCRKVVRDFDLIPEVIQRKYLDMNIVLPFIVEQLEKEKKYLSTRA